MLTVARLIKPTVSVRIAATVALTDHADVGTMRTDALEASCFSTIVYEL